MLHDTVCQECFCDGYHRHTCTHFVDLIPNRYNLVLFALMNGSEIGICSSEDPKVKDKCEYEHFIAMDENMEVGYVMERHMQLDLNNKEVKEDHVVCGERYTVGELLRLCHRIPERDLVGFAATRGLTKIRRDILQRLKWRDSKLDNTNFVPEEYDGHSFDR